MDDNAGAKDPADRIIDRYAPNATPEQRAEGRENLNRLVCVIIAIEDRLAQEWYAERIRENGAEEVDSGRGLSPTV
jgi:hypothetical protein